MQIDEEIYIQILQINIYIDKYKYVDIYRQIGRQIDIQMKIYLNNSNLRIFIHAWILDFNIWYIWMKTTQIDVVYEVVYNVIEENTTDILGV